MLERIDSTQRVWPDRREGWSAAGWAACVLGPILFITGYLAAFSVVGAALVFAGTFVGVAGLIVLLGPHPRAWAPLVCVVTLLLLWLGLALVDWLG